MAAHERLYELPGSLTANKAAHPNCFAHNIVPIHMERLRFISKIHVQRE